MRVARLAVDYRQAFKKDVVIDMVCYRRRGPQRGRQPVVHPAADVRHHRQEALGPEALHRGAGRPRRHHAGGGRGGPQGLPASSSSGPSPRPGTRPDQPTPEPEMTRTPLADQPSTRRSRPEVLKRIGDAFTSRCRTDFAVHPRLKPQLDRRAAMATEGGIDWAIGELLAFGSLVLDGVPVRLAGQDSRRGTFVQRHSVLIDRNTGAEHTPLKYLDPDQAQFWVVRLAAERVRGGRLRVRLLGGQPDGAGAAGRPSSATSSTARRRSSTSSSPPARRSGASAPA